MLVRKKDEEKSTDPMGHSKVIPSFFQVMVAGDVKLQGCLGEQRGPSSAQGVKATK